MKSRRFLTSVLAILFISLICRAYPGDQAVETFLQSSGIPTQSVAVKIIDLSSGETIASHNEATPLVPASIMKAVTTAALLGTAGPDWRYHTRVYIDGPIDLGYLRGNVIVEGACDPTLNSEKNPYSPDIIEEICEALTLGRINRIEGSVIIDQTNFAGPAQPSTWGQGDLSKYYGCGSHALNYSDNSVGDKSVANPSAKFVAALKQGMKKSGIDLEDQPMTEGRRQLLFDHVSSPLDEIMRSCMMRSDNMFAESMLRTYGKLQGGDGSTTDAVSRETNLWKKKKLPMEGITLVDGSGLSRSNRVTANFMSELLRNMSGNAYYASFFPLAGQEGTLRKFLAGSPLDSYIAMKTGSMTGIQCYAGYKLDDDYVPTHVIVIIMNDIPANRDRVKQAAEKMLLTVFQDN